MSAQVRGKQGGARRRSIRALALSMALAASSATATATAAAGPEEAPGSPWEPLRVVVARFAGECVGFARDRQIQQVAVGQVTAPAAFQVSASARVEALLIEELRRAGLAVARTADTEIKGEYWLEEDEGDRPDSVGLLFRVVNVRKGGPALKEFALRLELTRLDPYLLRSLVSVMFGINLDVPVSSLLTVRDAQRELRAAARPIQEPGAEAEAKPVEESVETEFVGRYGLRVEVKGTDGAYAPRPLRREGPFRFVDLAPDEAFRLVLVNQADDELAGEVTIDGINVLEFSRNARRRFLIPPAGALPVEGWIESGDDRLREFQVRDYGQSAFAELGRANHGELGLITARFARCYKSRPKGAPAEELPGHAIGRGSEKAVRVEEHTRWIDPGDAVIHIRYRVPGPPASRDVTEAEPAC